MKQLTKLVTNKVLKFPARMFTQKDLDELGLLFVENQIFFNRAKPDEKFKKISKEIKKHMTILNYTDFTNTPFSEKDLLKSTKKQIKSNSDFVILPHFKNETDYDVRMKIELAGKVKMLTNKEIILEMSYKCNINENELAQSNHNFDYLSIFYGTHYGHYPSFVSISEKIISFKSLTSKKVLCMAVPLKFAGVNSKDCRLMPCFNLIADGWSKNWRQAKGSEKIKVVDPKDLASKDYEGWIATGYLPNQVLPQIQRNVFTIFQSDKEGKLAREEFEKQVYDEVFTEINNLVPATIESYVNRRFSQKYFSMIIAPYREKVIISKFRQNAVFQIYTDEERILLESYLRTAFSPSIIEKSILAISEKIRIDQNIPVAELIKVIQAMQK